MTGSAPADGTPGGRPPALELLIAAARDRAERGEADAIGAEHVLLALLEREDVAAALTALGVEPPGLAARLEAGARKGRGGERTEPLQLTSHARRLIEAAERDARQRGDAADARHVAVAAFGEPRGVLARALSDAGVAGRAARQAIEREAGLAPARRKADAVPGPAEAPGKASTSPKGRDVSGPSEAGTAGPRQGGRREPSPPRAEEPVRAREPRREHRRSESDAAALAPRKPLRHLRRDGPSPWGPRWRRVLLLAVPAALLAQYLGQPAALVFGLACAAVLPLAAYMGDATEHLAARTGPTVGGLLNATFGNAAELIIAIVALRAGYVELVKASITGSILGNLLLIMGLSLLVGGFSRNELRFNRTAAGMSAAMLAAAVVGLVFPALFHATHPDPSALTELRLSEGVAIVLIVVYLLSLLFTLRTHRSVIGGDPHEMAGPVWGVGMAIAVLTIATAGVAVMSEVLVHAVEGATATLGLTETFLGLIIIPLIGNAAEHSTAVVVARKGKMDLALQIAYGSSTQIALLVAPLLVFVGLLVGQPMNLVFTPFEVMAVFLATIIASMGTGDGESHWFEGIMLLAVYLLIALAAFFV